MAGGRRYRAALLVMLLIGCVTLLGAPAADTGQPQQTAQDGFVPMTDIPSEDRLPAAPLLAAAYSVVWAIAIGYLLDHLAAARYGRARACGGVAPDQR